MPIDTTKQAIQQIFRTLNPEWSASDIRQEPGKEKRDDRWILMLECKDKNDIPHRFILPNKSPEGKDLTIKVFVTGRVTPCFHCGGEHRSSQCPSSPPSRAEPRRAADSQPRESAGVPHQIFDYDTVTSNQPEKFRELIDKISDNKMLPACEILKEMLLNSDSPSVIAENCDIDYDSLEDSPIMTKKNQ